jgi:serine/threonine-protein kinase
MDPTTEGLAPALAPPTIEGGAAERRRRIARHVEVAMRLLDTNELDAARDEIEAALLIDPHHPRARAAQAMVLLRTRDYVAASEVYEGLLAEFPGDVSLAFNLGVSYLAAGHTAHATRAFRDVLHVRPDHARARALASVAERGGRGASPRRDGVPIVGPAGTQDVQPQSDGVLLLRVAPGSAWRVRADALLGTVGAVEMLGDRVYGLGRAVVRGRAQARALRVDGDAAFVRASRLLAHNDSLAVGTPELTLGEPLTELRGHGAYVVDAGAPVARVRVSPGEGARLRAEWFLGREGTTEIAPIAIEGTPFVRVTGDGAALVELHAVPGGSMADVKEASGWERFEVVQQLDRTPSHELLLATAHGPGGFQRTVVLKRHFAQCDVGSPYLQRLAHEALAYELLAHPSIVRLYDFLLIDGQPVFVFECVRGVSLGRLVRALRNARTPFPDHVALYVAHSVFSALAAAHQARRGETGEFAPVIHRDVHPRNVLLAWTGEVKLANFAIAKVAGASSPSLETTMPGTLRGTYGYMAPEQVLGDLPSVRTDVYAASLVLWELLARRRAFDPDQLPELECLQAMASPRLPPIGELRPDIPARIAQSLTIGLAPNADDRHIAAADFARILEESIDLRAARQTCVDLLAWVRNAQTPGPASVARLAAQQADTDETAAFTNNPAPSVAPMVPPTPPYLPPMMQIPPLAPWPVPSDAPMAHSQRPRLAPRSPLPWLAAAALGAVVLLGTVAGWVAMRGRGVRPSAARGSPSAAVAATASATARTTRSTIASATPSAPATESETGAELGASPSAIPLEATASAAAGTGAGGTRGSIVTGSAADHHRVFVDGRVVGEGEGTFEVPCGAHVVRIGSAGQDHTVVVPCGGVADLR